MYSQIAQMEKDPNTYAVIGAALEVHQQLGCGFLEAVYQEAFALELEMRNILFEREAELPVFYKQNKLATFYRADFICFGTVIVELKALTKISGIEEAQILNYLKAGNKQTGLLINFGAKSLEYKRFVFSKRGFNPSVEL
jgi:GxxExxY protein